MLDYNLNFRVIFGEFFQSYEGTKRDMTPRMIDTIALGKNGDLKGDMRFFSSIFGRVLDRTWKDIEIHKMPQSAISQTNYTVKQQKSANRLNFGDSQSMIDRAISMGVMSDLNDDQE